MLKMTVRRSASDKQNPDADARWVLGLKPPRQDVACAKVLQRKCAGCV